MSKRSTNAWFQNLMVESGQQPVDVLPYYARVVPSGLDISVPVLDSTSFTTAVIAPFVQNMALRATVASTSQKVTGYTDLGCTVQWTASGGSMTANLVRGAAYTTMTYVGLRPVVNTLHAFISINGTNVSGAGSFTGTKFKCVLNNGQTWILYTSASVTFTLSAQTLTAGAVLNGTVRAALLPASGAEAALDAGATRIHTGGTVSTTISGSTLTKTMTWSANGTGTALTYAMIHHQERLTSPSYSAATIASLRGNMRAVVGNSWTLTYPIPALSWNNAGAINGTRVSAVQAALDADQGFVPTVEDPYFGGKSLAKAARLALIADQLGDTPARDQLLGNLKPKIVTYLDDLRYDTMWGGIVSVPGLTDPGADFGNGRYNDHYFHYGYLIYAAAVVAKFDAAWLAVPYQGSTMKTAVNDLVRDIACPVSDDPYFVKLRHFDPYVGHSWAAGLFEFDSNRNQESTSEAVNAWYALQLWGTASSQPDLTTLGKTLLAEELYTCQRYWQMKQADTIYPASFRAKGAIGIVWGGKVDYGTWFGAEAEKIHGIQMLPITPATEALIPDAWIAETWPNNLSPVYNGMIESWKSIILGAYAQINANDAWTRAQALTAYDDGISKTQLLYHIATQA